MSDFSAVHRREGLGVSEGKAEQGQETGFPIETLGETDREGGSGSSHAAWVPVPVRREGTPLREGEQHCPPTGKIRGLRP